MKVALHERKVTPDVVVLGAQIASSVGPTVVRYRTDSGALVRIDGVAVGAFDREHERVTLDPASHSRDLTLEVERRSLPTNGLPPGPGLRWRWIVWRAGANPRRRMTVEPAPEPAATPSSTGQRVEQAVPLWGHSHLDVAWLWTYDQTRRKALRTFSTALSLLDADSGFVFMQSQPQLFDYVREDDAKLFARVVRQARAGRFDPGVAALWVEPDCNVPSGESLLRQMLYAHCFCVEHFGVEPAIAWLPDTFGFARTLPSLLAHAGIRYFGTTKLQWNDTTRFEHPQFVWRGPDGAEVIAASIDRMEGGCDPQRVAIARERGEPLIVGYGDGGGGPTREQLDAARHVGRWERPHEWFARLDARRGELPVHDDELYLEYHRGVYTTHHDVKAQNAWLERRLTAAEEQAAWCVAIGAPTEAAGRVRRALCDAWRIVLRNQFHDVLPGTSIAPVYVDARAEYARAHELVDAAVSACRTILPRAARNPRPPARVAPVQRDGDYLFESDALHARVLESGALVELTERSGGENLVAQANLLALYRDRPKRWDAWNIDAGYERSRRAAKPRDACVVDGALQIRFDLGRSRATMQIALFEGEPFLRVELAVDWHERHRLLRVENWFTASSDEVVYGAPHGIVRRRSRPDTAARRAQFEVPGQRFAMVRDTSGGAVVCMALDTYGWSGRALGGGGTRLGHSLLRATTWPDPDADAGEQAFSWAYAALRDPRIGDVERLWKRFARDTGIALFESLDPSLMVVACKPAHDGDGVVVRVRECDGEARVLRLRCAARMRQVVAVDGLERPHERAAYVEGESLVSEIDAFGLRAFRVRF